MQMDASWKKIVLAVGVVMAVLPFAAALFFGRAEPEPQLYIVPEDGIPVVEKPSYASRKIRKLSRGEVTVLSFSGSYAQVDLGDGTSGFVMRRYLKKAQPEAAPDAPQSAVVAEATAQCAPSVSDGKTGPKRELPPWQVFGPLFLGGVVLLTSVTAVMRWRSRRELIRSWESRWMYGHLLLYGLFVCEIGYFVTMIRHNPLWFCFPDRVGWPGAVGAFLFFAFVCYNHFMCLIDLLRSRAADVRACRLNWKVGFMSLWYGAIAAAICSRAFRASEAPMAWVLVAVLIGQAVQIVRIRRHMPGRAAGTVWLYCAGVGSLIVTLFLFIPVAVLVAVAVFVVYGFFKSHGMVTSDDAASEPMLIYGPDGKEYYIRDLGNEFGRDQFGHEWIKTGSRYMPLK